jgi:hypothetical protein
LDSEYINTIRGATPKYYAITQYGVEITIINHNYDFMGYVRFNGSYGIIGCT